MFRKEFEQPALSTDPCTARNTVPVSFGRTGVNADKKDIRIEESKMVFSVFICGKRSSH
jgi:hypothetical protein